jgi:MYXO-CTERM domain-containing protein
LNFVPFPLSPFFPILEYKIMSVKLISVLAAAAIASASNAALVYGGGTETGSRFNAGAGVITYMNCFTAIDGTAAQNQLAVDSAIVGIRRLAAAGALTDVGIKIYAAEMTYDGTNFGRGANYEIYSSASLGAGAASVTQLVNTGAVSGVTLNLETLSNAGLGGFWLGVEFTGANAANVANGWRVVNTPTTGASINGFGMFNYQASGAFQAFYTLGAAPTPSRFMVDVNGTLVPAPGALALLGVAGLAGARRRRS